MAHKMHPTPALLTEPYALRLRRWFELHPERMSDRVLSRSQCATCGIGMRRVARGDLTDSAWSADDGTLTGGQVPDGQSDGWQWLNWASQHDVARYSAAVAHRSLLGIFPWEHHHTPLPGAGAASEQEMADMARSFRETYGVDQDELVTTPVAS